MKRVQARTAEESDQAFLRELFFVIRAPEFGPASLTEEQLQALLYQQYEAMRAHYQRAFPEAVYRILEREGDPVGYEAVRELAEIHLIDIALMPLHQRQGIGTERMRLLMAEAEARQKPVILSVEVFNPAKRLYERLGFREYEEFGMYKRMRWSPSGNSISPAVPSESTGAINASLN